jgi:histidinol-phosphate/aromatic aminotransferase/cobyric acid decarboxylase-like protein
MSGGVAVEKAMRERGVAIRAFREGIRITVGPWPLMESCLEALAACV